MSALTKVPINSAVLSFRFQNEHPILFDTAILKIYTQKYQINKTQTFGNPKIFIYVIYLGREF